MSKKGAFINTMLGVVLLGTCVTLAQEPVQNIDPHRHPNLAAAQHLIAEANNAIRTAQKDNRYDMHGHAQKARDLLAHAADELKSAAEDANR
jgi:hypothetical protein